MNEDLKILAGLHEKEHHLPKLKTLAEFERSYIEMIIHLCNGNIPEAAKILDISASTLYRKTAFWAQSEPKDMM